MKNVRGCPWRTLVAEVYPLIWPFTSSACLEQHIQARVPGCWFSVTIGLVAATARMATGGVAAATRPTRNNAGMRTFAPYALAPISHVPRTREPSHGPAPRL